MFRKLKQLKTFVSFLNLKKIKHQTYDKNCFILLNISSGRCSTGRKTF